VVALGGVNAWQDGRENPDTFQALLEYPKGFMVSYSTSLGTDSDSSTRIMGKKGTLINVGGEGSQRWKLVEEKGQPRRQSVRAPLPKENHDSLAKSAAIWAGPQRLLTGAVEKNLRSVSIHLRRHPAHMKNWFDCLRSRDQPNATIDDGFAHSVAVIMAALAQREGKKRYWDADAEEILEHPPTERMRSPQNHSRGVGVSPRFTIRSRRANRNPM